MLDDMGGADIGKQLLAETTVAALRVVVGALALTVGGALALGVA